MTTKEVKKLINGYQEAKEGYRIYTAVLHRANSADSEHGNTSLITRTRCAYNNLCKYEQLLRSLFDRLPDDEHAAMMIAHYIDGLSWYEISDKYNYSDRHIYRINSQSLALIAKSVPESFELAKLY